MARAALSETSTDLIQDSGSVLWSIVSGEQLEYPVTLNFVENVGAAGYVYEAVVVEALNVAEQTEKPTAIKPGGVQNTLTTRVPVSRGAWNGTQAYNHGEIVSYNGLWYRLLMGIARTSSTVPSADPYWEETLPNTIYVQFPDSLGTTWAVQPTVATNTYGFFELRVTEPFDGIYQRTWKPVRGMVEILFSPTSLVPG